MPESRFAGVKLNTDGTFNFTEKTFVDYPQEPKVYPGERIPTILDDLEEMAPREPTTLADEEFEQHFFAESWPRLLQKLSLDDCMECFLEWRDQYEDWCSYYGINIQGVARFIGLEAKYHAFYLLDRQLFDVLRDRMEENIRDMDHETFVQELLDIFGEVSPDLDEEFDEEEEDDAVREDLD